MAAEGMRLLRITGPQTPHRYHPDSKVELDRILNAIAERGRDPYPRRVRFTTWTLAYNRMKWVTIDALGKHWERARLDAEIAGDSAVNVTTSNVTAFTLEMGPGGCPLDPARQPVVTIDGQKLTAPVPGQRPLLDRALPQVGRAVERRGQAPRPPACTRSTACRARSTTPSWIASFSSRRPARRWRPGVAPWVAAEEKHAIAEWRRQFRGEAQVRDDKDITDAEIAASNLVLWGDPGSNRVLARIADRLPVKWTAAGVVAGGQALRRRHPRADPDLSQSAEPEEVRRAQQRLHLPRIRLSEQRAPDSEAARLRRGRYDHAARSALSRQDRARRLLRRRLENAAMRIRLHSSCWPRRRLRAARHQAHSRRRHRRPRRRPRRTRSRTRSPASVDRQAQARPAAARRPDLLRGRPLLAPVQRILQARRDRRRQKLCSKQGEERAAQLAAGQAPWTTATGLVVRGYISKIDKSVQPYGLVVPPSYSPNAPHRWRLDTWFHGRDETLTQVNFLTDRMKNRRRVHAARHHRAAPLRPLLQRQQVRRRSGFLRSARRRQAQLPDRREPHSRPRLQHGRRQRLALRRRTIPACGPPPRPARASPNRRSISRSSSPATTLRPRGSRSSGTTTTPSTTPPISSTCP